MPRLDTSDVPDEIVAKLRVACSALPEIVEEPAWTGIRWRVRTRTFAHVIAIDDGSPPVLAGTIDTAAGPVVVVTFRSEPPELDVLRRAGHPFFFAGWGRDVVGLVLDGETDWDEVAELLTESFCLLAPKKLVARIDRPPPSDDVTPEAT